MRIEPKIKGFLCTTAHPAGCAADVDEQIQVVEAQGPIDDAPKRVLVIGASGGYGLASRIVAAMGCGAATMGVFFERPAKGARTASPGGTKRPHLTARRKSAACMLSTLTVTHSRPL